MPFIEWNDRLSVNISSIDRQHKTLIGYINKLNDALTEGKADALLSFILKGLASYTQAHFIYEEMLLQKYHYPETKEHQTAHGKLFLKVDEFKARLEQGDTGFALELLEFLKKWLNNHILRDDTAYSAFLLEQGIK